jgi:hypothetical protein
MVALSPSYNDGGGSSLMSKTRLAVLLFVLIVLSFGRAGAIEVRVTAPALERTLQRRVFNQPDAEGKLDRHYLRGSATKGCSIYVDDPHVSYQNDRVLVSVKTHFKLGFGKNCFGLSLSTTSEVSFVPEAEGESVGFRDARIDHLSDNKELNLLLEPFLARKMPQEMKVNAAEMMRTLLVKAPVSTGYQLTLTRLEIQSMQIEGPDLVVNLDADIRVE